MESIGSKLKNLRLQKGLSLEDAQKKTKIHPNILKAIEEDSLINFSPVYIRGFIKIYCKFLGVDPRDFISDYKQPQPKVSYVSDLKEKARVPFKMPSLKFLFLKRLHINPKIALSVALTIIFVIVLFNLGKAISSKIRALPKRAVSAPVTKLKPEVKTAVSRPQQQAAAPSVKVITLDIHAKENSFLQVKSDGRVVFQNILRKGRSESWQAKDKIELSVGNAAAVELEVNGKHISGLGRKGQSIKNILITKEGINIKR